MRRFLSLLFDLIQQAAGLLGRFDGLAAKFRAAPQWGSLVLGRSIHPSAVCNETDCVSLGERTSISYNVVFHLGASLTSSDQQPLIGLGNQSSVGANTVFCAYGSLIQIAQNTHIGSNCHFGAYGRGIVIGSNCLIASHCSMVDTQHIFKDLTVPIIDQSFTSKGIVIKDDVWLGAGVVLMDGVTVGKGAVVGAGAVVTQDVPPEAIAVGVPAKVIRYRSDSRSDSRVKVPSETMEGIPTGLWKTRKS